MEAQLRVKSMIAAPAIRQVVKPIIASVAQLNVVGAQEKMVNVELLFEGEVDGLAIS